MAELAEQIVKHFPTEDKVFCENNEILKGRKLFKNLFSNLHRNLGVILMVPEYAVVFVPVFVAYVKKSRDL